MFLMLYANMKELCYAKTHYIGCHPSRLRLTMADGHRGVCTRSLSGASRKEESIMGSALILLVVDYNDPREDGLRSK
jgi:hypothetical protein